VFLTFRSLPAMDFVRRAGDNVNLVVYDNMQPIVWITTVPFFIMGLISSAIRLYTRAFIRKPFGTDDWFMLVGTVSPMHNMFVRSAVANVSTGLVHRPTIHRMDVDHLRRRAVSLATFGGNFANWFLRHVTSLSAVCASYWIIHANRQYSISLQKSSTTFSYNSSLRCRFFSSTAAHSRSHQDSESQ
jgi:hypothetical protein